LKWYPGSFNPYGWIIEDIKETFLNLNQSN